MPASLRERAILQSLIAEHHRVPPEQVRAERRPLAGGFESAGIEQLSVRYRTGGESDRVMAVVVKRLEGASEREAAIYESVIASLAGEFAPRLHAVDREDAGRTLLYLEALKPIRVWPWREPQVAQRVLDRAAELHVRPADRDAAALLTLWDYESELEQRAQSTLECLEHVRRRPELWSFGGAIRWTRRVVQNLPTLRQELLAFRPFGRSVIHGDLHPGNVVVRQRRGLLEPVLLDWGRSRIGSPLEDVSCWLQSLGTWEPVARRRHDTLLAGYLTARGLDSRIGAELRAAYWLAGASNALSGALLHHLCVLLDDARSSDERATAAYVVREWVRVLRRAASYWC